MKAIIVGAGIGGLTLALELVQKGIDVEVFERAESLSPVGAGIMLAPNALKVFEGLGIRERLEQVGHRVEATAIQDFDGRTLSTIDMGFGARKGTPGYSIGLHRAELHQVLVEELGAEKIRLGQTYLSSEDTQDCIFALFETGETAQADFLVGCDGGRSEVRNHLFGRPVQRYSGQMCWRGVARVSSQDDIGVKDHEFVERWGQGLRFGYVRISPQQVYWYATQAQKEEQGCQAAQLKTHVQGIYSDWTSPVAALLERTPSENIVQHALCDVAPSRNWSKGRACLLGDSIHPTTPNLGQGAGMAIESAAVLAHTLQSESSLDAAFGAYERLRYRRTRSVTQDSWRMGQIANWQNAFGCGFRNWMIRMTPTQVGLKRYNQFVTADLFIN